MEADGELERAIADGLDGRGPTRYGLPFLGDNNFLPGRIRILDDPRPARWLVPVGEGDESITEPMRLTVTIDRADMSKTETRLFRITENRSDCAPAAAWVDVAYG